MKIYRLLWVASVLSCEPPGAEVTYFLWLSSFWVWWYDRYVTQWHCADKTNGVQGLITKEQTTPTFSSFYLPFISASTHNIPFHIQTDIHPVVDIKKILLGPVQAHVNGICWVHFFFVCARPKVSHVCWGVSLRVCPICLPMCPAVCELTSEFEQGGAGR